MIDCRYFEPTTVAEACTLLAEHGDGAKVVAGGQSLSLKLSQGEVPEGLVSIHKIPGLDGITTLDGSVSLGALVTLHDLEGVSDEHPTLRVLSETIRDVADRQIRNRATLGGSICEAHPASDITAVLTTLDASVKLTSTDSERVIPLRDFITDAFTTVIQPSELLTEVIVPSSTNLRSAVAYHRFALRAGDYPVIGVGASVSLDETGKCQEARIVLGNCLGAPTHAAEAEQQLQNADLVEDDQPIIEAANLAAANITPLSESMASSEFKRDLVGVLTADAIAAAVALASA
jgi:aerobic carbon-monoxide dehydrogenase medium subunit